MAVGGPGELVAGFGFAAAHGLVLGADVPVAAPAGVLPLRLGAQATAGVPGVELLVGKGRTAGLGLRPAGGVLLAAPARDSAVLRRAVLAILGDGATADLLGAGGPGADRGGGRCRQPATYRELYIAAATTCRGLGWPLLAAIGQVESNHGRNAGVSSAGARGPMQFLPSTFAAVGVDGDGDGLADIDNPFDAVYSAARYLCESGAGRGTPEALHDAVFAYNHSEEYVRTVLALADAYAARG